MLDGLFVTPAVTAITEALASANAEGKVVVIGNAKLASALAAQREVISVGMSPRAARKLATTLPETSSVEAGSLAAVIGVDVTEDEGWDATLREWARCVNKLADPRQIDFWARLLVRTAYPIHFHCWQPPDIRELLTWLGAHERTAFDIVAEHAREDQFEFTFVARARK